MRWTPYKWLDLDKLFNKLLKNNDIIEIKYFTAIVKWSEKNKTRRPNQTNYINAIKKQIPHLKVIEGHFLDNVQKIGKDVNPPHKLRKVITREEKGTDVNLAINIVDDVHTRDFDCICLVSNDSDLSQALKISQDNKKSVVLIAPITYENLKKKRTFPTKHLKQYANVVLPFIHKNELSKSLLPSSVKQYKCPKDWET